MEQNVYTSANTFSRRPGIHQIISYLIIIFENICFWVLVQNNYSVQNHRLIMIVLYSISSVLLLTLGGITSYLDPSDPVMREFKRGNSAIVCNYLNDCLFCDHCQSYVLTTSRHCKLCDRCMHRFDHHCIWINNCIGGHNYKPFIGMIVSAFVNLALFVASVVVLWSQNLWIEFLAQMIVNWVMFTIAVVFSLMILGLICLHFYLIWNQMTTFQFIIAKRDQEMKRLGKNKVISMNQTNQIELSQQGNKNHEHEHISQNNQTEEFHRTQNLLQPPPGDLHQQFQNIQNQHTQDKNSQMPSIDQLKESQSKCQHQIQGKDNAKTQNQFEELNLDDFYTKNRSLKILVGKAVQVRPKTSLSGRSLRGINNSKIRSINEENKSNNQSDVFVVHVNGKPQAKQEHSEN